LAKFVKAVVGRVRDGIDETAPTDFITRKIYDALPDPAATPYSNLQISITKYGNLIVAIIYYEA